MVRATDKRGSRGREGFAIGNAEGGEKPISFGTVANIDRKAGFW
jgi:hypothetical protein